MRFGNCRSHSVLTATWLMVGAATVWMSVGTPACCAAEPDESVAIASDEPAEGARPAPPRHTLRLPPVTSARPETRSEPARVAARRSTLNLRPASALPNGSRSQVVQAVHTGPQRRPPTASGGNRRRPTRRVSRANQRTNAPKRDRTARVPVQRTPRADKVAATILVQANEIAQSADSEKDFTEIIENCEKGLQAAPSEEATLYARRLASWALNRRGQLRADRAQTQAALADFSRAIQYDPQRWRAIHNRGVSRAQFGRFAAAFDDFTETIRLQPDFAKAYSNRGTLFLEAGDPERARVDFDRAIKLDPQLVNAQVGRGRACAQAGDHGAALESFDAALQLDQRKADTYCGRGAVYARLGEYHTALSDYATAIQLDPDYVEAYRQGAWLLATCPDDTVRDAENAVLGAERALELSGQRDHELLDTLAAALASAGEFDTAMETLQQALVSAPDDVRQVYRSRLQLYQRGIAYRTAPPVNQAVFVEEP